MGVQGGGEIKGGNWENCKSIINKTYFKKKIYRALNLKEAVTGSYKC